MRDPQRGLSRRLLLGASLPALAGCDTITDTFDDIFGEKKVPLKGDRRPVFAAEAPIAGTEAGASTLSLPPPALRADWPQAGGGTNHAGGHPTLGAPLGEAWRVSIGDGNAYRRRLVAPPVIADGVAFAADATGAISAIGLADGRRRWRFDTRREKESDGALGAGVAVAGGVVFAVTGLAEAMALDAADGKVRWRVPLPAPARGAPTVADGRLLVPTIENELLALSIEDGKRVWTYRSQPVPALALGLPAPAVEGELVIAGFGSGELAALRAIDGRLLWSETLSSARGGGISDIAAVSAAPVIDRGRVFAASLGGLVIAADLRAGRRLWEREITVAENLAVAGNAVFLITTDAELLCLGREDGRVRWVTSLGRFEDERRRRDPITWGGPVLAGGRLLVGGSHGLIAQVDPGNGEVILRSRLPGGATLPPAFADNRMVLLTDSGDLVALVGRDAPAGG